MKLGTFFKIMDPVQGIDMIRKNTKAKNDTITQLQIENAKLQTEKQVRSEYETNSTSSEKIDNVYREKYFDKLKELEQAEKRLEKYQDVVARNQEFNPQANAFGRVPFRTNGFPTPGMNPRFRNHPSMGRFPQTQPFGFPGGFSGGLA